MTPRKTWLVLLIAFGSAFIHATTSHFVFELRPGDENGHKCTWSRVYPYWFQIVGSMLQYALFLTVIMVYSVMLLKFSLARKRLRALQKEMEEDYFTKSTLTFHQTRGIFKKKVLSEVPGLNNMQVQTLEVKNLENGNKMVEMNSTNQKRKRRSSSVITSIRVLVSHVRAARYVLVLLVILMVTWTPINVHIMYNAITHMIQKDQIQPNRTVDFTAINTCLSAALQNKQCNMEIEIENYHRLEIEEGIRYFFHIEKTTIIEYLLGVFLPLFNSIANPILYAFWYAEFRNYLGQIPEWFKRKKEKPDDFKFEMQNGKI